MMRWGVMAVVAVLIACSGGSAEVQAPERERATLGGDILATADGVGIHRDSITRLAEEHSLDPEEALHRLEDEALLHAEAERRGLAIPNFEVRQAAVQFWLQRFAQTPVTTEITDAERESARAQLTRVERRRVSHLLIPNEGFTPVRQGELASRLHRAVLGGATLEEARGALPEQEAARVRFEALPPFSRGEQIEAPFLNAVFAATSVGPIEERVETSYGQHVIFLQEIIEARNPSAEDVETALLERARAAEHHRLLQLRLSELSAETGVELREEAITEALARDLE